MAREAKCISVFGAATCAEDSVDYADARRLGSLLAAAGYVVYNGGYQGVMAAVSRGVQDAGGRVIGITLQGDPRPPNRWLSAVFPAADLHARLQGLLATDAWLALNGSIGTLNEVALGWAVRQKATGPAPPLILIGPRWRRVVATLGDLLAIAPADLALLTLVDTIEDAVAAVQARI
ncbi:MAG TPA: LOG family protein [Chloroflexia bacterium]|nr:LOG family protein [Chloroflexia bacterium]